MKNIVSIAITSLACVMSNTIVENQVEEASVNQESSIKLVGIDFTQMEYSDFDQEFIYTIDQTHEIEKETKRYVADYNNVISTDMGVESTDYYKVSGIVCSNNDAVYYTLTGSSATISFNFKVVTISLPTKSEGGGYVAQRDEGMDYWYPMIRMEYRATKYETKYFNVMNPNDYYYSTSYGYQLDRVTVDAIAC